MITKCELASGGLGPEGRHGGRAGFLITAAGVRAPGLLAHDDGRLGGIRATGASVSGHERVIAMATRATTNEWRRVAGAALDFVPASSAQGHIPLAIGRVTLATNRSHGVRTRGCGRNLNWLLVANAKLGDVLNGCT